MKKQKLAKLFFIFTQAIIPDGKSEEAKGQSSFAKAQAPHAKAFQSLYSLLGYNEQVFFALLLRIAN